MCNRNCNRNECLIVAIASSVVIGIVAAVLRITGIITTTPAFLWVLFGIAVVYLAVAFVVSSLRRFDTPYSARTLISTFIAGILALQICSSGTLFSSRNSFHISSEKRFFERFAEG